jgi:hypothetical protein
MVEFLGTAINSMMDIHLFIEFVTNILRFVDLILDSAR